MSISIDPSAHIGSNTRWGEYCIIGPNVEIGPNCEIGHHVVLHAGTRIGAAVRIDDGAVIGKRPMRAANTAVTKEQDLPSTVIGDNCIIGTHVVIYRGAALGQKVLVADLSTVRENVTVTRVWSTNERWAESSVGGTASARTVRIASALVTGPNALLTRTLNLAPSSPGTTVGTV